MNYTPVDKLRKRFFHIAHLYSMVYYSVMNANTTQENILALRALGMSQTEIAAETGILQPRLSRWEAGIGIPAAADDGLKLARLLAKRMKRRNK